MEGEQEALRQVWKPLNIFRLAQIPSLRFFFLWSKMIPWGKEGGRGGEGWRKRRRRRRRRKEKLEEEAVTCGTIKLASGGACGGRGRWGRGGDGDGGQRYQLSRGTLDHQPGGPPLREPRPRRPGRDGGGLRRRRRRKARASEDEEEEEGEDDDDDDDVYTHMHTEKVWECAAPQRGTGMGGPAPAGYYGRTPRVPDSATPHRSVPEWAGEWGPTRCLGPPSGSSWIVVRAFRARPAHETGRAGDHARNAHFRREERGGMMGKGRSEEEGRRIGKRMEPHSSLLPSHMSHLLPERRRRR